jgi:choline dehydrogenase
MCNIKFVILLLVIVLVVVDNVKGDEEEGEEESYEQTSDNTFDYIVVGVGQTGSVVAARLAENGKYKILGIEAGERTHRSLNGTDYVASDYIVDSKGKVKIGKPWTRFDVPAFVGTITSEVPTPYPEFTAYFNGVEQSMNVGKLLGGSGAHNGFIWSRHTKATIDSWGIKGWSYEEVLPFYKKSENVSESSTADDLAYHGLKGPIQISDTPATNSLYSAVPILLEACEALGYPYNPDFNGASRYGCGLQVFDIGDGVRYSAANAYLPSALKKGNLHLSLGSHATRILIKEGAKKGSKPIAYGVEYVQDGKTKRAYADKEIIVTLSAVYTPQLLMLSGIGPASDLKALNIPVWVDNPNVGRGILANQLTLGANEYPCAPYGSAFRVSDYAAAYALNRSSSPWAHAGQFAYAYLCSKSGPCDNPDVMVGFQAGGFFGNIASTGAPVPTLTTQVTNTNSHARGIIRLTSSDPFALLNVTIDTYAHPEDLKTQIFGWRAIRKILGTYPATTIIGPELSPGAQYQTDAELADWILAINANLYNAHWVGSAVMGNEGSTTRVTDPKMRVVGIDGLRIGDTSVLYSVNSHLQASATMCGERVVDFILNPNH